MDIYRQLLGIVLLAIYVILEALYWFCNDIELNAANWITYVAKTACFTAVLWLFWVA